MRIILIAIVLAAVVCLFMCGCSANGFEGQVVGGCTLHQANSALAGVAWADCPAADRVYVSGSNEGYIPAAAPYASSALSTLATYGLLAPPTTNVTTVVPKR